jgi:hypothetical protein
LIRAGKDYIFLDMLLRASLLAPVSGLLLAGLLLRP